MGKSLIKLAVIITFTIGLLSVPITQGMAAATEKTVRVTLPDFTVQLNGNKVDNQYRQYPLIVYRDMTYVPMTWFDSRLLGLETKWSNTEGLIISEGNVTSSYETYKSKKKYAKNQNATIPTFKITVNGKQINNSKEEFPLLNLRNVTYFPLTWEFTHDEFGWDYIWDKSKGLIINSNNPQVRIANLPIYAGENDVALFNGYFYFVETVDNMNLIYRAKEDNTANKEWVYSYQIDTMYGFLKHITFEIRENELWFGYHLGGATMGSDFYGKINKNGKAAIEHSGYLDFKNSPKGTLIINQFLPPGGNNLRFIPKGATEENGQQIGDPDLIYGWIIKNDSNSTGYGPLKSTTILGDDVYVLASSSNLEKNNLNKVYKINLNTNETTQITNFEVTSFKISDNKLYYVKNSDKHLYSSNLDGSGELKLSDNNKVNWYGEVKGDVFYTIETAPSQYSLYKVYQTKEDILVLKEKIKDIQISNNNIICLLETGEDYGVKVFNQSGQLKLAIVDHAEGLFVHNDDIVLYFSEDKVVKTIRLKK